MLVKEAMLVAEIHLATTLERIYELELLVTEIAVLWISYFVLYYFALLYWIHDLRNYLPLPEGLRHFRLAHFYRGVVRLVFVDCFFACGHKCLGVKIFIYIDVSFKILIYLQ